MQDLTAIQAQLTNEINQRASETTAETTAVPSASTALPGTTR
jgi:hypothetical protein